MSDREVRFPCNADRPGGDLECAGFSTNRGLDGKPLCPVRIQWHNRRLMFWDGLGCEVDCHLVMVGFNEHGRRMVFVRGCGLYNAFICGLHEAAPGWVDADGSGIDRENLLAPAGRATETRRTTLMEVHFRHFQMKSGSDSKPLSLDMFVEILRDLIGDRPIFVEEFDEKGDPSRPSSAKCST